MTMSMTISDNTGFEPLRISSLRRSLLARSLSKAARRAIDAFVAWRAFRRAESELMALDDRALKDIGLDRSEIGSALMDDAQERRNGARQARRIASPSRRVGNPGENGAAPVRQRVDWRA
jgi:uncharacterized protein YjiS (DUF1127 family)